MILKLGLSLAHCFGALQAKLGDEKEVVCLAMKHDLLAVGSQRQVTLLDPRLKGPGMDIANVESHDGEQHASLWRAVVQLLL